MMISSHYGLRTRVSLGKAPLLTALILTAMALGSCNPLRGGVFDSSDDGKIRGEIEVSRGYYRVGEEVEVVFTIENISRDVLVLEREDGPVQDVVLSKGTLERRWSEENPADDLGNRLVLEPGEISRIVWKLGQLEEGNYAFGGMWWSRNTREKIVVVGAFYGPYLY